jgi:hypothetical protein
VAAITKPGNINPVAIQTHVLITALPPVASTSKNTASQRELQTQAC